MLKNLKIQKLLLTSLLPFIIILIILPAHHSFAQESQKPQKPQKPQKKQKPQKPQKKNINIQPQSPPPTKQPQPQPQPQPQEEPQEEKIDSLVTVGLLGIYDFFDNQFGFELRTYIEKDYMEVPIEWQFALGDNGYFRIRAWPSIYFIRRESLDQPSAFFSIYNETTIKKKQNNSSGAEFGLGGGFAGGGFSLAAWFSSNYYQGEPSVKDLLSFRTKVSISYAAFYAVIGFRIGAAIGKIKPQVPAIKKVSEDSNNPITKRISQETNKKIDEVNENIKKVKPVSTALTTADIDIEFGLAVYKTLTVVLGAQLKTDNLSGLLDSAAKGQVPSGTEEVVNEAVKFIFKAGVTYSF